MRKLVEPIKSKKDLELIESYFAKYNMRNHLIWIFAITTGLRISDVLAHNVRNVKDKNCRLDRIQVYRFINEACK